VWGEFEKALVSPAPARFVEVMECCGAAAWLLPGLSDREAARRRLEGAAGATGEPEQRFAALFHGESSAAADAVCQTLKPPRRYRDLGAMVSGLGTRLLAVASLSPAQRLEVLQRADALRRPDRFEALLEAVEATTQEAGSATDAWRGALAACQAVDTRAVAATGLSGEAIGDRIRSLREAAIGALDTPP
jgi:tRNA nucleotidyltransferase (CCA-adding enzyme)